MNTFGPRDEEEQHLLTLAKLALDPTRTQLERELAVSQLLHASLTHKRQSECFWEAAEQARAERPRLELLPYVPNTDTEL